MNKIKVYSIFNNPYLISREMAVFLTKNYTGKETFDFDKIRFISAAFADEFLKRTTGKNIVNAEDDIKMIFRAVNNRKALVAQK